MKLELYKEKVNKLLDEGKYPEEIKEALFSFQTALTIKTVGKKNGLNPEQISDLGAEVGRVLLGAVRPEEMSERLIKLLKITPQQAGNIFREINIKIFFPLREKIAESYKLAQSVGLGNLISIEEKPSQSPVVNLKEAKVRPVKKEEFSEEPVSREELVKTEKMAKGEMTREEIKEKVSEEEEKKEIEERPKIVSQEPLAEVAKPKTETRKRKPPFVPKKISFQEELKPIGDIEKPQELSEEIFRSQLKEKEPLFGKIEFPGKEKEEEEKKKQIVKPQFSEIEYQRPKRPSSVKKVISFGVKSRKENERRGPEIKGNTIRLKK